MLLTAYADTEAAIRAINELRLDHYLMKPWSPPEARLYPVLDDLLEDWEADSAARLAEPGLRLVGHRFSAEAHATRDFVARNGVPYRWLDIADPEARRLMAAARLDDTAAPGAGLRGRRDAGAALPERDRRQDRPAHGGGAPLLRPRHPRRRAGRVWRRRSTEPPRACGRSWWSAMRRVGRPGQSSRIENYLGFPSGVSGADLARRATAQALRLGAEMLTAREVLAIRENGPSRVVTLDGGEEIGCHSVLVATGVHYSRLEAPGVEALTGSGVYYGAAPAEAAAVEGEDVVVVGAANSAGQAVVDLATRARRVVVLCRADGLEKSMSHYLIERIRALANVEVMTRAVVTAASGEGRLRGAHGRRGRDGRSACPRRRRSSSSARGPRPTGSATPSPGTRGGSSSPAPACGGSRGATAGAGARPLPPRDQPARRLRGR